MPGTLHQGILLLLLEDPWLSFDLLGLDRPALGVPIDRRAEIELRGDDPLTFHQGYPDLVLVDRDPKDKKRGVVITIEAQKELDLDKRWMIPVYQSHLAKEHRLDTWAVVISLDPAMSRAIRRWRRGGPPRVDALLLDVQTVPKDPWLDECAQRPTAAVLVGALHGYAGDFDAARRGFQAARLLAERHRGSAMDRGFRHGMTILAALPQHQREQLIGELPMQEQHSWMDVERRSGTYAFGRAEGREEGLEQGLEQGRAALVELIFNVLAERHVTIDPDSEAKIRSCGELPILQRWVWRAINVRSAKELLEGH